LFKNAIVRIPGSNFAEGLTSVELGAPSYDKVLQQHSRYCEALRECGLTITTLDADLNHPDSTFVEDTAVLTPRGAILTRPGARSREGEVVAMRQTILRFFPMALEIEAPGTVDGGDICEADYHFFLGLSQRTNEEGCRQLAAHLAGQGYASSVVDVRAMTGILHLEWYFVHREQHTCGHGRDGRERSLSKLRNHQSTRRRELCSQLRPRE